MEELKLESKGSIIGLIIKIIVFSFLVNQAFNLVEKFNGQNSLINWILIFSAISYLIYRYMNDKTVLTIDNQKIKIKTVRGLPKKLKQYSFELKDITKVKLIQTHTQVYGKKMMELIDFNDEKQNIEVNLRYYQLVKLQDYLNENLKIETSLIG